MPTLSPLYSVLIIAVGFSATAYAAASDEKSTWSAKIAAYADRNPSVAYAWGCLGLVAWTQPAGIALIWSACAAHWFYPRKDSVDHFSGHTGALLVLGTGFVTGALEWLLDPTGLWAGAVIFGWILARQTWPRPEEYIDG